jgi:hypothetical protein
MSGKSVGKQCCPKTLTVRQQVPDKCNDTIDIVSTSSVGRGCIAKVVAVATASSLVDEQQMWWQRPRRLHS